MKPINSRLKIVLIILSNMIFILSLKSSWIILSLLISFLIEAYVIDSLSDKFKKYFNKVLCILNIMKISLLAYMSDEILWIISPILIESLYLFFQIAEAYFASKITSLPVKNFKNFGNLQNLYNFSERISFYKKHLFIRSLSYALLLVSYLRYGVWFTAQSSILLVTATFIVVTKDMLSFYRYLKSNEYQEDLRAHIQYHDPQVVLYVAGVSSAVYQLQQWIPVFERLQERVIVIAREKFWYRNVQDTSLHMVYAKRLIDIDNFLTDSTRLCLYPANGIKNAQMLRKNHMKHIFINHGDSDKIVNQSKFLNAYDTLYLAGPMARDRMISSGFSLSQDSYAFVGRPQTSLFLHTDHQKHNTILYAPTWEGFDQKANYTSVKTMGVAIVKDIIEQTDYDILFKPHPLTGTVDPKLKSIIKKIESMINSNNRGEVFAATDILELMNKSDILISDISSIISDYLVTDKPYIVTNPRSIDIEEYVKEFRTASAGYILNSSDSVSDIIKTIDTEDPKREDRISLRRYVFSDLKGSSFDVFQETLTNDYDHQGSIEYPHHTVPRTLNPHELAVSHHA